MLLIITGSNCTFTPGYWQSSLKKADNRVTFSLTARRISEISLSDSVWNVTDVFSRFLEKLLLLLVAGGNIEFPLGYSSVLLSSHLFTQFSTDCPLFLGLFRDIFQPECKEGKYIPDAAGPNKIHTFIFTFNFASVIQIY